MSAVRRLHPRDNPDRTATLADIRRLAADLATSTPRPPPPHDLDAECIAVVAVLDDYAEAELLQRIEARDMYSPDHAGIIDAHRSGDLGVWRSAAEELRGMTPTVLGRRLVETIDRVRRLARCRRALHHAELAAVRLRAGDHDVVPVLRAAAMEVKDA